MPAAVFLQIPPFPAGKQIQPKICIPSQVLRILSMFSKAIQYTCRALARQIREESRMKATGIVRKVDELGRIVLPIELRRTLGIEERDALEIYVEGNTVILRKYQPSCVFCDSADDVVNFKGKNICRKCLKEMGKL